LKLFTTLFMILALCTVCSAQYTSPTTADMMHYAYNVDSTFEQNINAQGDIGEGTVHVNDENGDINFDEVTATLFVYDRNTQETDEYELTGSQGGCTIMYDAGSDKLGTMTGPPSNIEHNGVSVDCEIDYWINDGLMEFVGDADYECWVVIEFVVTEHVWPFGDGEDHSEFFQTPELWDHDGLAYYDRDNNKGETGAHGPWINDNYTP